MIINGDPIKDLGNLMFATDANLKIAKIVNSGKEEDLESTMKFVSIVKTTITLDMMLTQFLNLFVFLTLNVMVTLAL